VASREDPMSLSSVWQKLAIWNGEEEDELKTFSISTFSLCNRATAIRANDIWGLLVVVVARK